MTSPCHNRSSRSVFRKVGPVVTLLTDLPMPSLLVAIGVLGAAMLMVVLAAMVVGPSLWQVACDLFVNGDAVTVPIAEVVVPNQMVFLDTDGVHISSGDPFTVDTLVSSPVQPQPYRSIPNGEDSGYLDSDRRRLSALVEVIRQPRSQVQRDLRIVTDVQGRRK